MVSGYTKAGADAQFATKGSLGSGMPGSVALDSYAGSTDDAKLAAAISDQGAQTYPGPIRLSNRYHVFNNTLGRVYDGFAIEGPLDSWKSAAAAKTSGCEVHLAITPQSGEPAGYWLNNASGGSVWNWSVRNIYFSGTGSTQFISSKGSGSLLQGCSFHSLQFNGLHSVFGNSTDKCAFQISVIDGYWSIEGCADTAVHLGGSDNRGLFADGLNIDSGIDVTASGKYHIILDYLDKSNVGPVYVNCDTKGWRGIKILGGSGNGGGLSITGAIIEGRNATNPALGELVTVQGGWPVLDHCTIDCGMTSPSAGEVGMVSCIGANAGVTLRDCTFELASGQDPTKVPCVYIGTGARAKLYGAIPWQRDTGSPSWGTSLPRVNHTADAGTILDDSTPTNPNGSWNMQAV